MFLKLFDSKVQPILSYGSELWGVNIIEGVESVHTRALKRFLNVSVYSSNSIVYGETGRYPLSINHKINSLRYWLRLQRLPNTRINKQAYDMLVNLAEQGKSNWASHIRDLLFQNGFGIAWISGQVGNEKMFLNMVKERLKDCYIQGWSSKILNSEHLNVYSGFKSIFMPELYLYNSYLHKSLRNILTKFRCGVSEINSHRHKFSKNVNIMHCPLCDYCRESEIHFLLICTYYEDLRVFYLPQNVLSSRNLTTMNMLLSSNSIMLAKCLQSMFIRRRELMPNQ